MTQPKHINDFARYLIFMTAGFCVVMVLLATINWLVDPAHILTSKNVERKMAADAQEGLHLDGAIAFNERLFQMYRIALMDQAPDRIVLGSSRAMQIRDAIIPGRTLNNAVSGASFEDYFAIIQMYRERGMLPKKIIFSIDPWLFNVAHQQVRWISVANFCRTLAQDLESVGLCLSIAGGLEGLGFRELISLGYLRESITRLLRDGTQAITIPGMTSQLNKGYSPVRALPLDKGGRLADGSFLYPTSVRELPLSEIENDAVEYAKTTPVYSLGGFKKLDPIYKQAFAKLLSYFRAEGIEVSIIMIPYHPTTAQMLSDDPAYGERLREVEQYVRETAGSFNIEVIGGYMDDICGKEEFYDGMHPRQSCMVKLIGGNIPSVFMAIDPL